MEDDVPFLKDAICFTPSKNLLSDPQPCSFLLQHFPRTDPQSRFRKKCFLNSHRKKTQIFRKWLIILVVWVGTPRESQTTTTPNHHFFCHLFQSEDNEVAIHQGFGMSWYLDFTHLPVPCGGRFVAAGW